MLEHGCDTIQELPRKRLDHRVRRGCMDGKNVPVVGWEGMVSTRGDGAYFDMTLQVEFMRRKEERKNPSAGASKGVSENDGLMTSTEVLLPRILSIKPPSNGPSDDSLHSTSPDDRIHQDGPILF